MYPGSYEKFDLSNLAEAQGASGRSFVDFTSSRLRILCRWLANMIGFDEVIMVGPIVEWEDSPKFAW